VRELFHRACDLDPVARARYLDGACADDAEIRREIESLFALERQDLVDVLRLSNAGAPALAADPEPERIGRYELLELIGEGGFGSVYLARQFEPVVRHVALKLVKPGMDTPEVLARFEAERQTLALMDHPSIPKLFDAGTTERGRPYFAMELVQGEPVTTFCDRERLSVARRLELFRVICGAVQHAHQKGVVHRDMKPSNVLVTVSNGTPEPKLIDFGIAAAQRGVTGAGDGQRLIGTLHYMSPEQAASSGLHVDTRSDVYALGVLLYELLTGSTPLELGRMLDSPLGEIQRRIREEEPETPSQRLAAAGAAKDARRPLPEDLAARRGTDVRALARLVRGDLEGIVLKCLQKDREQRYPTASALAEDVGRFLQHEPVQAVPWTRRYRLHKYARRHRAALLAAVSGAVLLVLAAVVSLVYAFREARQRKAAEHSGLRAQAAEAASKARADDLEQAVLFLQDLFAGVDVAKMGVGLREDLLERARAAGASSLTVPELDARAAELQALIAGSNFTGVALDALKDNFFRPAREAIDKKFRAQPLVRARLLQTLASTLYEHGVLDLADEPQRAALEIRRRELGADHADTLTSMHALGILLHAQGDYAQAEPEIREALEGFRRVLGSDHPSTLTALGSMGYLRRSQFRFEESEACYREALEGQRRVLGAAHLETLTTLNNLGSLLMAQGKRAQAAPLFLEALEGFRAAHGSKHPDTLMAMNNAGSVLHAEGRPAEAEARYREALEGRLAVLGDAHPDTLASLNNLGFLLHDQGRLAEAEPYYREALEKRRLLLGPENPRTLNSMNNLAGLLKDQGRLAEAEALYREALSVRRRILPPGHPETLNSLHNLGWLLEGSGRTREAEEHYREALAGYRAALGDEHPDALVTLVNLSTLLLNEGRATEALELLTPASPALRRVFTGDNRQRLGRALMVLGRCLAGAQRFEDAEAHFLEAHEILTTVPSATAKDQSGVLGALAELYDAWNAAQPDVARARAAALWRAKLEDSRAAR
jgi:serine/threonine protein kinase/Tfp pilus assembly protein PilF